MERIVALEESFKKRYNRDVEVWRDIETKSAKLLKVFVEIRTKNNTYLLTECYKDDQTTDYVTLEYTDKCHSDSRYLDAEVHVADLIGG